MRVLILPTVSLLALVGCTTAPPPPAKELRTPEKAPHIIASSPVVDAAPPAPPPVVEEPPVAAPAAVELGEPVDAPPVVVDAVITEAKASKHDEPRLSAHKKKLAKLEGGKVTVSLKHTWRHRVDARARTSAGAGAPRGIGVVYGSASIGLEGASLGDAVGVGGLGMRATGVGGGGIGIGTGRGVGLVATRGRGSGEAGYGGDGLMIRSTHVSGAVSKPHASASPLRAGTTDDNAQFAAFLQFLEEHTATSVPTGAMKIDVAGRRFIKVLDADGKPFPGAAVLVRDWKTEKVIATATTYGDGRAPFYPSTRGEAPAKWLIEANDGVRAVTATWQKGDGDELVLQMPNAATNPAAQASRAMPLDVLFLIDTTGSMADEIERIKETLLSMTAKVKASANGDRAVSLRYGAVLYRDVGDAYVTATRDFTSDVAAFEKSLRSVEADGGGDTPESLNQGLAEAMVGVAWRDGAAKVAFLVADAVPHMDYADDIPYGESLQDAVTLGVRIHAVAASGLADDAAGSLVFRQVAQYARGRFIFIEYGRDIAASARAHGVEPANVASNNLDDILLREIRREIEGWGQHQPG